MKGRNPILGSAIAILFLGIGGYRLYSYYIVGDEMESWKLIFAAGFIVYGLVILFNLLKSRNEEQ